MYPDMDTSDASIAGADLGLLSDDAEIALIKQCCAFPRMVEAAAEAHEPHRIAFFLYDLASEFHSLWNKGNEQANLRFVVDSGDAVTKARLAMIRAVAIVIANGLAILGVKPLEEMR